MNEREINMTTKSAEHAMCSLREIYKIAMQTEMYGCSARKMFRAIHDIEAYIKSMSHPFTDKNLGSIED